MDRRRQEASKLRAYMDGIKQARETTDEQWVSNWIARRDSSPYMPRTCWIAYLERCALIEAEKLMEVELKDAA